MWVLRLGLQLGLAWLPWCLPAAPVVHGLEDASALVQAAAAQSGSLGLSGGDEEDSPLRVLTEQLRRFLGPEGAIERKLLNITLQNLQQQLANQTNASDVSSSGMQAMVAGLPQGLAAPMLWAAPPQAPPRAARPEVERPEAKSAAQAEKEEFEAVLQAINSQENIRLKSKTDPNVLYFAPEAAAPAPTLQQSAAPKLIQDPVRVIADHLFDMAGPPGQAARIAINNTMHNIKERFLNQTQVPGLAQNLQLMFQTLMAPPGQQQQLQQQLQPQQRQEQQLQLQLQQQQLQQLQQRQLQQQQQQQQLHQQPQQQQLQQQQPQAQAQLEQAPPRAPAAPPLREAPQAPAASAAASPPAPALREAAPRQDERRRQVACVREASERRERGQLGPDAYKAAVARCVGK